MSRRAIVLALVLLAACTGSRGEEHPGPGQPLSVPELKLRVLASLGAALDYCDPDEYPIPHGTPLGNARRAIDDIRAHETVFDAILAHEGISSKEPLENGDLVRVYDDYKQIAAISLERAGDRYRFTVYTHRQSDPFDKRVTGTIGETGAVDIESKSRSGGPNCPICLAARTLIGTPAGPIPVREVVPGIHVWSTDGHGQRIRATVLRVARRAAVQGQEILRVRLADGRSIRASAGHPTADGRSVGELRRGDRLDGSVVVSIGRLGYDGRFTHDLLPSGPTGTYFADGVLLGSTLSSAETVPA